MWVRRGLSIGLLFLAAGMVSCESGNGACYGEVNGHYFQLSVLNYTTTQMEVFLNGRPIGEMEPYRGIESGGTTPGALDGGELPVCDGWVIDAKGYESESRRQFCSTPEILQCPMSEYCTFRFMICESLTINGECVSPDGVINWEPEPLSAYCDCPGAWLKCDVN